MYFFRTFKKSTAPYKVHNMGLRYIKTISLLKYQEQETFKIALTYSPFLKQLSVIEFEKRTEKERKEKTKKHLLNK